MNKDEKIHELTRALEAIAGYAHMKINDWQEKHPDIVERWSTSHLSNEWLSDYAKDKLEEINDRKWTF